MEGSRIDLDLLRVHKSGAVAPMIASDLDQFSAAGWAIAAGTTHSPDLKHLAEHGRTHMVARRSAPA